ncbi:MAG: glycan-binding surface protein [Bacteroides sp.]|nr:glycan-binding surface protein [Bacteroides sp.]
MTPNPIKVGQTLTITGTNFNLVAKVILPGGTEIEIEEATDKIEIETPADMKEGAVILVAKSGAEVSSEELTLVKPAITSISGTNVKNNTVLEINGTNLDLVSQVGFQKPTADVSRALSEDTYVIVTEFLSQTATKVTLTLPAEAANGVFVLGTASDTETEGEALTFIEPAVTSIAPLSVKVGENVILTGTDLDLVTKVVFGSVEGTIDAGSTATNLIVTAPVGAEPGKLTLSTDNGTVVETTQEVTINVTLPVITHIEGNWPAKKVTVEGSNFSILRTIYLADENGNYTIQVTDYFSKTDTRIEFYFADGAASGFIQPQMETFDGDKGLMPEFYMGGTDPVTDPSYVFYDFDNKGSWWGSYGAVENDPALSLDGTNYFRINQDLPSGWVDFFWRNSKDNFKTDGVTVSGWVIKMDVNVLGTTTPGFKFRLNGTDGDFWALIPGLTNDGGWYTVTIPLTDFRDGDGSGTNVLPSVQNINAEFGLATSGDAGNCNICIDNIRFEPK